MSHACRYPAIHAQMRGRQGQRRSQAHLHVRMRELAEVVPGRDEVFVGARRGDAAALQHNHQVCSAEVLHLMHSIGSSTEVGR